MSGVYLGLDTATEFLSIGLWSPQSGLLATTVEVAGRSHGARLIGELENTLNEAGIDRGAIAAIAAGGGPGSYTGLRVGGAAARGLARALGIPLAGCDTLAAIAYAGLDDGQEGLSLLDARRGNVYLGRYLRRGEELLTLEGPRKARREEALAVRGAATVIEGSAPDPGYLARRALAGEPYRALYL